MCACVHCMSTGPVISPCNGTIIARLQVWLACLDTYTWKAVPVEHYPNGQLGACLHTQSASQRQSSGNLMFADLFGPFFYWPLLVRPRSLLPQILIGFWISVVYCYSSSTDVDYDLHFSFIVFSLFLGQSRVCQFSLFFFAFLLLMAMVAFITFMAQF